MTNPSAVCKILVAEDDKFLSKAYEFKLRKMGCEVILASDGEETLEKIKAEKPDLILLDLIMPKKTGFDVLLEMKSIPELKDIPVIIMSNLGQEADVKKGLEAGAMDYVVKANTSLENVAKLIEKSLKNTKKGELLSRLSASKSTTANCPDCRQSLPAGAKFCPGCGKKIEE